MLPRIFSLSRFALNPTPQQNKDLQKEYTAALDKIESISRQSARETSDFVKERIKDMDPKQLETIIQNIENKQNPTKVSAETKHKLKELVAVTVVGISLWKYLQLQDEFREYVDEKENESANVRAQLFHLENTLINALYVADQSNLLYKTVDVSSELDSIARNSVQATSENPSDPPSLYSIDSQESTDTKHQRSSTFLSLSRLVSSVFSSIHSIETLPLPVSKSELQQRRSQLSWYQIPFSSDKLIRQTNTKFEPKYIAKPVLEKQTPNTMI